MVCLPLIAEQNAHEICLTQECFEIVRRLLWSQTTTLSLRNINPMFEGSNLCVNRECSQVRMVDAISQPGCAECGAGGLVLTDNRPYAFLRALLEESFGSNSLRFWSNKGDRRGGKGTIIFTSISSSSGGGKVADCGRRMLGKYWKLGQYGRD